MDKTKTSGSNLSVKYLGKCLSLFRTSVSGYETRRLSTVRGGYSRLRRSHHYLFRGVRARLGNSINGASKTYLKTQVGYDWLIG